MKILFCSSEVVPFAKTGGLADVAGALPLALEALGEEVAIVMPQYKSISKCQSSIGKDIKVYFITNDKYFKRDGLYQDKHGDYPDNLERFSYFSRKAIELVKDINYKPDIIHINDWQAALVPAYLKILYARDDFFKDTGTILTIHNLGFQGIFAKEEFPKLGLDWSWFNIDGFEFYGRVNLLKAGIIFSDIVNTVSPTYAHEIQTEEFGFGLEGLLKKKKRRLFGILNGLDYSLWDPATDKFIAHNFSSSQIEGKARNKEELQNARRLSIGPNIPLIGIVSRLTEQKGLDILCESLDALCRLKLQVAILGVGDLKYHKLLESIAQRYPKQISLYLGFNDPLAHKIYAGCDMFLMPSRYEPCGLGQMVAFRYGAIPIAFNTGGLADTVTEKNGFLFTRYTKEALSEAVKKAFDVFKHPQQWLKLVNTAMACRFSWKDSAKEYLRIYGKAKET